MGGLLDHARNFFRGLAAAPTLARTQWFSVVCSDGHRLHGQRTDGYQALRCPECGEGLFVLPRSPLPEPSASSTAPAVAEPHAQRAAEVERAWSEEPIELRDPDPSPAMDVAADADGEVEWVDEDAAPRELGPRDSPEDLAAAEIAARPERSRRPSKAHGRTAEAAPPAPVRKPYVPLGQRLRKQRNPLIFAGVVLLVVATGGIRAWRAELQDAPRVAELGRTEGLAALDAGDFDRAYQLLAPARAAVRRLGGQFDGAEAIIQGADEAEVLTGLGIAPEELIDQAARADPKVWAKTFDSLHKGRTILVVAQVTAVPDGQGKGRYDLDYRIFPPGEGNEPERVGRIDLDGFKLFETLKPRVNDSIRFGARIVSFQYDSDGRAWLVGLDPASGVIMTHQKALDAMRGTAADPETEDRP